MESLPLEFALEFRRDAEEVDCQRRDDEDASNDSEEFCDRHDEVCLKICGCGRFRGGEFLDYAEQMIIESQDCEFEEDVTKSIQMSLNIVDCLEA